MKCMMLDEKKICEIVFFDNKTGQETSVVGKVKASDLEEFNHDNNDFISFTKNYNPPVYKADIKEIIIYREEVTYSVVQGKLEMLEILDGNRMKGSIS